MAALASGRRRRATGIAILAIASVAIASAAVGSGDRQRVRQFEFTSERPGKATGVETVVTFPGATQQTAVATIVTKLARGTQFNTSVPDQCEASDEELMAQGAAACPPGSKVGDGLIQLAELGAGDATLLNADRETIFLVEFNDGQIRVVNREAARGRVQRIDIAEGVTLQRVELELDRIREGGESYIGTPERCPDNGKWVNSGTFVYRDGVEQRERAAIRCG